MIGRFKVMKRGGSRFHYRLTDIGLKRIDEIGDRLNEIWLDPARYSISRNARLGYMLGRIRGSPLRIYMLSNVAKGREMDLTTFTKISDRESRKIDPQVIPDEFGVFNDDHGEIPFVENLIRESFYGIISRGKKRETDDYPRCPGSMLELACSLRFSRRVKDAMKLYDNVVDSDRATRNQWMVANIGRAKCLGSLGNEDEALKIIEGLIELDNTTQQRGYLYIVLGWMLSETARKEEAIGYLTRGRKIHIESGSPMLTSLSEIYIGIIFFRKKDYKTAEYFWSRARKNANRSDCTYLKAYALGNLSDVEIIKGNLDRSERYLDEAQRILELAGDKDGLAGVEFNRALLSVARGDIEMARDHFRLSEEMVYPLPCKFERDERRRVFLERIREKGIDIDEGKVFIWPPRNRKLLK